MNQSKQLLIIDGDILASFETIKEAIVAAENEFIKNTHVKSVMIASVVCVGKREDHVIWE